MLGGCAWSGWGLAQNLTDDGLVASFQEAPQNTCGLLVPGGLGQTVEALPLSWGYTAVRWLHADASQ